MSVRVLRLVTGEDVVGDVEFDSDSNEYKIKEAVQLVMIPSKSTGTSPSFGFAPFPIYREDSSIERLTISKNHVIFDTQLSTDFANEYNSRFGGIITPPKNIVI